MLGQRSYYHRILVGTVMHHTRATYADKIYWQGLVLEGAVTQGWHHNKERLKKAYTWAYGLVTYQACQYCSMSAGGGGGSQRPTKACTLDVH